METMKIIIRIGVAVIIMGILGNLIFRGGADKGIDIRALVDAGALVIDTRSASEFAGGHIDGAILIPFDAIGREIGKHESDKTKSIIVYCHSGARAAAAKKTLEQSGYVNVVNGGGLHHMQKALQP